MCFARERSLVRACLATLNGQLKAVTKTSRKKYAGLGNNKERKREAQKKEQKKRESPRGRFGGRARKKKTKGIYENKLRKE